jgi:molybdate transport system substrate-binding protein
MKLALGAAVAIVAALGVGCGRHGDRPEPLRVAAAADLARAFEEVGDAFARSGHPKPVFTFGSTGLLAKQIEHGAPYGVFAAANVEFVDDLVRENHCDGNTKGLYARGRIVLYAAEGAPLPENLVELADARYAKVAIANPEHAPYGRAAVEALRSAGVYDVVAPRLVFGENVQQTLQFAQSKNAEVAIVALSLAIAAGGRHVAIPADLHRPIDQALVSCGKPSTDAAAFIGFVGGEEGRSIMRRYGFVLPGEALVSAPGVTTVLPTVR